MARISRSAEESPVSLRAAWMASPGPMTLRESLVLFAKGVAMGSADIVPGVSGGTIAFISGIYQNLLDAIASINLSAAKALLRGDLRTVLATAHLRFLVILLSGIGCAVVSLARLITYLLDAHPVPTWGFFFGLIIASILIIGRQITTWAGPGGIFFLIGTVAAWFFVGMIPVTTPEAAWFIFLSGAIAICAMILPGISGSFLLLILGKYQFVTGAIKNPLLPENMVIIVIFGAGCVFGILGFSRVLGFMLHRYHNGTMALLTGLMSGSLRKVWPWKETLETVVIRGKTHVLRDQNVLPAAFDSQVLLAVALAVGGFFLVMALEKMARRSG